MDEKVDRDNMAMTKQRKKEAIQGGRSMTIVRILYLRGYDTICLPEMISFQAILGRDTLRTWRSILPSISFFVEVEFICKVTYNQPKDKTVRS